VSPAKPPRPHLSQPQSRVELSSSAFLTLHQLHHRTPERITYQLTTELRQPMGLTEQYRLLLRQLLDIVFRLVATLTWAFQMLHAMNFAGTTFDGPGRTIDIVPSRHQMYWLYAVTFVFYGLTNFFKLPQEPSELRLRRIYPDEYAVIDAELIICYVYLFVIMAMMHMFIISLATIIWCSLAAEYRNQEGSDRLPPLPDSAYNPLRMVSIWCIPATFVFYIPILGLTVNYFMVSPK
jgi:hypothetical protein